MTDKPANNGEAWRRTVVVDFDGVIARYEGWAGVDVFGAPVRHARDALLEFKEWGWRIVIWTTRELTPALREYLKTHRIPHDAVNSSEHNPPFTSNKPIAEVYIDDHSWYNVKREFSWLQVMRRMRKLYQPSLTVEIDDAANWAGWPVQLGHFLRDHFGTSEG